MTTLPMNSPLVPPADIELPLEIPDHGSGHPLRWRKVLQLIGRIRGSEDPVQAGLELFDAVGGVGGEKTFQRFRRSPEGRRLLRTRPDLVGLLGDREALAAMPDGSLGRAYLEFAVENGFAADGLVEKNKSFDREDQAQDPYRRYFWDRFTIAHDLWHVLTESPTTELGEVRLLAFSYAQTPQRGYLILLLVAGLSRLFDFGHHRRQWAAYRAGCRAHDLIAMPWEQYLAWPVEEVRAVYGVKVLSV